MGFVDPLKDVSVPEKRQAKFECTVTKEVPKVMWFRGAEIVSPGPKYEIIDDGLKHMLIINSCEFDDEAHYTIEVMGEKCSAQLRVEGKQRASCFLSVATPVSDPATNTRSCIAGMRLNFVQPLQDKTVKEGKTAQFELELTHDNVPVLWYRNEVKLHVSRTVLMHVEGNMHRLEMRTVSLDDTCQIKAEAKGIYSVAQLTVIGKLNTLPVHHLLLALSSFTRVSQLSSETFFQPFGSAKPSQSISILGQSYGSVLLSSHTHTYMITVMSLFLLKRQQFFGIFGFTAT